jgi:hypothetical protein
MRVTTETSIGGVKVINAAKCSDHTVVISSIIEYEVTNLSRMTPYTSSVLMTVDEIASPV